MKVEESYYKYEPVKGFSFETWYYLVYEEEYIVYAVSQKGKALVDTVSHQVLKIKPGIKKVAPDFGEQTVSFNVMYWWFENGEWPYYSSSDKLVSKEIIEDGNLMVKFAIVSQSSNKFLKSTVYYKYYYSPSEDKGIFTNVNHEVDTEELPTGDEIDVSIGMISSGAIRSSKIDELNFGYITPFMHFFSEDDEIITYELDQYPESIDWLMIIGKDKDYDLANKPWVSVDYGKTGIAHGIIFDSSNVIESRENERDGIELQLYQANSIKLPGIDGRFAYIYFMRNHFEEGEKLDNELPEKYLVNYNAEFFTTENGGYKRVEEEASLYHSLIDYQPSNEKEITGDENEEEYSLTIYTHLTLNQILKILSSRALFNNAHVRVELYLNESLRGFVTSSRLAFSESYWIDWGNSTIFRKAVFPNLEPGFYVVKIFLENLIGGEKEFIGYTYLDLNEDTTKHLVCKSESKIILNILDDQGDGIKDVEAIILNQGNVISKVKSDENGIVFTGVPCCRSEGYELKLLYKGFLLDEEKIDLSSLNIILPFRKDFNFNLYDFNLEIKDYKGKTLDFDILASLTSDKMYKKIDLEPNNKSRGEYQFLDLPKSDYELTLDYNSIKVKEKINISETISKEITLYDLTINMKDAWNETPTGEIEIALTSLDLKEPITIRNVCESNDKCVFSHLYPGNYSYKIFFKSFTLDGNIKVQGKDSLLENVVLPFVFNVSSSIYEKTGGSLSNVEVILSKNGENKTITTDANGNANFSVPAGLYAIEVFDDNDLIGKRKIDVINDKSIQFSTDKTPFNFIIAITTLSLLIAIASIYCIINKNYKLWLKFLIVFILLFSIFLPWWSIHGITEESHYETSTDLYLTTKEMVTFTQNEEVYAGELSILDELFVYSIETIYNLIMISAACILFSIFLRYYRNKKRISKLILFLSFILMISCLTIYLYAINEFSTATVGKTFGSGMLDVNIPGENMFVSISCNWGPSLGFYFCVLSAVLTLILLFFENKKNK